MKHSVSLALFAFSIALLGSSGCNPPQPQAETVLISEGVRHPVTDKMEGVTNKMAAQMAPEFELKDVDGKAWALADLVKAGPVIVVSIKDECPCSVDSQPLFNEISKRFEGKATFVGLFNESPDKAKTYIKNNSVPYPVLIDTQLDTFKAYKAERSVYVTYVNPKGEIVKMWPGYWDKMLLELDGMLSKDTGITPKPFDPKYAPVAKSSGCQIYQGEGFAEGDKP